MGFLEDLSNGWYEFWSDLLNTNVTRPEDGQTFTDGTQTVDFDTPGEELVEDTKEGIADFVKGITDGWHGITDGINDGLDGLFGAFDDLIEYVQEHMIYLGLGVLLVGVLAVWFRSGAPIPKRHK